MKYLLTFLMGALVATIISFAVTISTYKPHVCPVPEILFEVVE